MPQYKWNEIPEEKLTPLFTRQVLHTPHLTVARLQLGKGALVPLHSHVNEQVTMLHTGALRFELDGKEVLLGAGQTVVIPPGVPHLVEVLEDSTATDLFTPAREDWIRGDDAYLRSAPAASK